MRRGFLGMWMALVLPTLLSAQGAQNSEQGEEAQSLTLRQAVEYALEHSKQLQSSRKNIDLYQKKVTEAISAGLPQIKGTVNYNTNFNYSLNLGGMDVKMEDQMAGNLSLSQLIFSGQWITGIQTAKIAAKMSELNVASSELDTKENVLSTYYVILVYERIREILKGNVANMESLKKHTENLFAAGVVEETDIDQIRINLAKLKNSLASVDRNVEVSYNLLRLQLGLETGTPITLTEKLDDFLHEDDYVALSMKQFEIEENVEYKLMNSQEELNKKMVNMQKWAYAPTIAGTYSYTYKIIKPAFDMSPANTAGIAVQIPIFSGLERASKVSQAKIELEQTLLNKSLVEDKLYMNEAQYKFELKNATENYLLQNANVAVARKVLQNTQYKYQEGAVSSFDLTQANTNYLQAESDYTESCLSLLQAKTKIERLYNILPY
ncbi:RND transporter [Bacteroidia bacterium]|nr:RND transporter [Bacteroidia bacterium]